jgi:hypothetical protein
MKESQMGQNNERSGRGSGQEGPRKNRSGNVLKDKATFEHAPHGSNEPSHRIQEMGQSGRSGTESEGSKARKQ